ncbi:MAG: DUF2628 domain-containing protein [Beijerinckiaceae bacterium]|nr:DUF2628 domain-containing protein [Beijerinckiaceae bacterium]
MAIYSVHLRGGEPRPVADAVFVCQDFSWKAFFFGPLWLLSHRLWAGLALWVFAYLILTGASATLISSGAGIFIAIAVQTLLGLEASRIREAKLARQGFRLTEIIAAPALDEAEAAFYRRCEVPNMLPDATDTSVPAGSGL